MPDEIYCCVVQMLASVYLSGSMFSIVPIVVQNICRVYLRKVELSGISRDCWKPPGLLW